MKFLFLFLLFLVFVSGVSAQTFYGSTDLKVFRDGRDKEFCNRAESPLQEADFAKFKGLNYFPVDNKFRVKAIFERTPSETYFQMPTSSGRASKFVKYGILKFKIGGKPYRLSVYQSDKESLAKFPEYADLLFVPFRDLTSRTETYGVGRYIDIKLPMGNPFTLDFNLAYNPNCAYGSDKYSCPIPPRENRLNVALKAGEKRYEYSGSQKVSIGPKH